MILYVVLLFAVLLFLIRQRRKSGTVAFFHPYCNAGGGGERVLWCAIRFMQKRWPEKQYIVFSGDGDASKEQILLKAKQRFGIEVDPQNVSFVFLSLRRIVEADLYPRLTLLCQTLAGLFLGFEALCRLNPEVFIDSMGYPLTLPLFKVFAGAKEGAYVHYPTISTDMIELVERRESTYNNSDMVARSSILSHAKLLYYRLFAVFYGLAGRCSDVVMVNGSWTRGHIERIWGQKDAHTVFPPCDVTQFVQLTSSAEDILQSENRLSILSIGQIRPEKNHALQLDILKAVRDRLKNDDKNIEVDLVIAGGCRNADDERRVRCLRQRVAELGLKEHVQFRLNVSFDDLLDELSKSLISVHTMWNEHFGISVVEGMAAGTIMLSHKSGGPLMDIVVPNANSTKANNEKPVGFLASTVSEYADSILRIMEMSCEDRDAMREAARLSTERFGEEAFETKWNDVIQQLM